MKLILVMSDKVSENLAIEGNAVHCKLLLCTACQLAEKWLQHFPSLHEDKIYPHKSDN